eukprot:11040015-Lingulodinium_polyedra.AAC.1
MSLLARLRRAATRSTCSTSTSGGGRGPDASRLREPRQARSALAMPSWQEPTGPPPCSRWSC